MSGNPPGKCCGEGYKWTGESVGKISQVAGNDAYIVGDESSKKLLVICPDVWGITFTNCQLIADNFAKAGFFVAAIDYFNKDPLIPGDDLGPWIKNHMPQDGALDIAAKAVAALKEQYKPNFTAAIGYCYGATVVADLQAKKAVDVASWCHPSFITEEQVKALKTPLHLGLAESDHIFADDFRAKTFEWLKELKLRYYVNIFSGTVHGFAARGNPEDPVVDAAMKKAFQEQLYFFDLIEKTL